MAIAGTLTVNVLARTLGFQRTIGAARKDLRGFGKQASIMGLAIGGLGKAIGLVFGGLSIRGAVNFARRQVQVADALAKTAETLDLTTEELGLFQLAAKTAGVESRQLNISIQRMSRRIGEASLGGGELSKTLIRLGLDAKALAKLSVGDQFLAMGEALTQITNQDERLAAIFKTFDSEGVPVFRVFGDNLDRARRLYERFNLALTTTDAAKLEEIATQAGILKSAFGAAGRNFLIDISPEVLKAIGALQDILAPPEKGGKRLGESAFERAVREKRELKGKPSILQDPIGVIVDTFKESQRLIANELQAGDLFKDKRNLPFGPAQKPGFATPGLVTQAARGFNEAVFTKPAEEITKLLRMISGNTQKTSIDAVGDGF